MRVFRLNWFSRIDGNRTEWFDRREAADLRGIAILGEPYRVGIPTIQHVNVPTTQAELVAWLNLNLRTKNV